MNNIEMVNNNSKPLKIKAQEYLDFFKTAKLSKKFFQDIKITGILSGKETSMKLKDFENKVKELKETKNSIPQEEIQNEDAKPTDITTIYKKTLKENSEKTIKRKNEGIERRKISEKILELQNNFDELNNSIINTIKRNLNPNFDPDENNLLFFNLSTTLSYLSKK